VRSDPADALGPDGTHVTVRRTDGSTIRVRYAVVRGDSLIGASEKDIWVRLAIPLAEVSAVDYKEFSAGKTAVAVVVTYLALWTAYIAIALVATMGEGT
jgi:hypothetical protein